MFKEIHNYWQLSQLMGLILNPIIILQSITTPFYKSENWEQQKLSNLLTSSYETTNKWQNQK